MEFWNTIRGVRLADTLIHCLPKLTTRKRQKLFVVRYETDIEKLEGQMKDGWHVVTSFECPENRVTQIVLEKED